MCVCVYVLPRIIKHSEHWFLLGNLKRNHLFNRFSLFSFNESEKEGEREREQKKSLTTRRWDRENPLDCELCGTCQVVIWNSIETLHHHPTLLSHPKISFFINSSPQFLVLMLLFFGQTFSDIDVYVTERRRLILGLFEAWDGILYMPKYIYDQKQKLNLNLNLHSNPYGMKMNEWNWK